MNQKTGQCNSSDRSSKKKKRIKKKKDESRQKQYNNPKHVNTLLNGLNIYQQKLKDLQKKTNHRDGGRLQYAFFDKLWFKQAKKKFSKNIEEVNNTINKVHLMEHL